MRDWRKRHWRFPPTSFHGRTFVQGWYPTWNLGHFYFFSIVVAMNLYTMMTTVVRLLPVVDSNCWQTAVAALRRIIINSSNHLKAYNQPWQTSNWTMKDRLILWKISMTIKGRFHPSSAATSRETESDENHMLMAKKEQPEMSWAEHAGYYRRQEVVASSKTFGMVKEVEERESNDREQKITEVHSHYFPPPPADAAMSNRKPTFESVLIAKSPVRHEEFVEHRYKLQWEGQDSARSKKLFGETQRQRSISTEKGLLRPLFERY